eukprot:CAMPEP_0197579664 /NCGR_PEP_ID=MMETSP1326-20131121/3623_1 /TAXON_ID=1155430 /ORGANISM="Genus nov. species nov., Strain RCC2288" /LENGTH=290 /DNA_ID=CAMNT_0043143201 /DNA_START=309 /DNA_END=1181 /DNA_ORIENTATION=-
MISEVPKELNVVGARGFLNEYAFLDSISDRFAHPKVLELGCGEGRSAGQLAAKYPTWRINCLTLKGYKRTSAGAVSFDTEHEIRRMLEHYNNTVPKRILGDESKSPWPFNDDIFALILSQAALSKIIEADVVVREAGRSLAKGGIALFGFGAATCKRNFWARKHEDRILFCGDTIMDGSRVRIYLMHQTPFDNVQEDEVKKWASTNTDSQYVTMTTTLLVNKATDENTFIFKCPSARTTTIFDALRHCPKFTPAWDRGLKTMSRFFDSLESEHIELLNSPLQEAKYQMLV